MFRSTLGLLAAALTISLFSGLMTLVASTSARAAIYKISDMPGKCARNVTFEWRWEDDADYADGVSAPWWVSITDNLLTSNRRSLEMTIRHEVGCEPGEAANTDSIDLFALLTTRPDAASTAGQVKHDGGLGAHQDMAKVDVTVYKDDIGTTGKRSGLIKMTMNHYAKPKPLTPSYRYDGSKKTAVQIQFWASYDLKVRQPDGSDAEIQDVHVKVGAAQLVQGGQSAIPPQLPVKVDAEAKKKLEDLYKVKITDSNLVDYSVQVTGSPRSYTNLAFLGNDNGVLDMLDLGSAADLFAGRSGFILPELAHETDDIYVAVDLTQYLSAPIDFNYGDEFLFSGGVNESLAGFLVSSSPISYESGVGFYTDDGINARLYVRGGIDGHAPEPATLVLLLLPVLGFVGARRLTGHAEVRMSWRGLMLRWV